tara:strand:+ start:2087 stop:2341 length:255 start_codon:yes stop_codon:yes gene_type:complete
MDRGYSVLELYFEDLPKLSGTKVFARFGGVFSNREAEIVSYDNTNRTYECKVVDKGEEYKVIVPREDLENNNDPSPFRIKLSKF